VKAKAMHLSWSAVSRKAFDWLIPACAALLGVAFEAFCHGQRAAHYLFIGSGFANGVLTSVLNCSKL
jgi:hypothetical protein